MNRIKRACKRAYGLANNDQGIAMIVAVVVGAVIMAFCLALLLVTYSLFAQTSRKTTQVKCKLMAQSYAEVLGEEFSKKPEDSKLQQYLGEKVKDQTWKATLPSYINMENGETATITASPDQMLELSIADDTNVAAGYILTTTFTYEENGSVEDEDIVEGNNRDDQIEEEQADETAAITPGAGATPGALVTPGAGASPTPGAGKSDNERSYAGEYLINAEIKCVRGDGGGKDVQTYTLNRQFRLTVKDDTE